MSRRSKFLVAAAAVLGIVFFVALAVAPVRPVDASDAITVTGTLTAEGVECQAMRGDDGVLYTLAAKLGDVSFATGDKVRVVGTIAEMSTCMQGKTISVTEITKAP